MAPAPAVPMPELSGHDFFDDFAVASATTRDSPPETRPNLTNVMLAKPVPSITAVPQQMSKVSKHQKLKHNLSLLVAKAKQSMEQARRKAKAMEDLLKRAMQAKQE